MRLQLEKDEGFLAGLKGPASKGKTAKVAHRWVK